jgi:hypothetical protein
MLRNSAAEDLACSMHRAPMVVIPAPPKAASFVNKNNEGKTPKYLLGAPRTGATFKGAAEGKLLLRPPPTG